MKIIVAGFFSTRRLSAVRNSGENAEVASIQAAPLPPPPLDSDFFFIAQERKIDKKRNAASYKLATDRVKQKRISYNLTYQKTNSTIERNIEIPLTQICFFTPTFIVPLK